MTTTTYHSDGTKTVEDRPEPTAIEMTRTSLVLAVSAYDHVHHMGEVNTRQDLDAVDRAIELVRIGCKLDFAVAATFDGKLKFHLLDRIRRAR